jgi:hypothetical protein
MDYCDPGFCAERADPEKLDPDEFARGIRRLAIETYRALNRPDTPVEELTTLNRQFEALLNQSQELPAAEITRWLRNAMRAIDARLHPDRGAGSTVHRSQSKRAPQTSNVH